MRKRRAFLGGATALALVCVSAASAGDHHGQRGLAILPPLESPDTDNDGLCFNRHFGLFVPYYGSCLTPISTRWRVIAYVPYYTGYCRRHASYTAPPYGAVDSLLPAPGEYPEGLLAAPGYGPYTGAPRDEAALLHLGGNGPYQPSVPGAIDFIDLMRGGPGAPGAPGVPCPANAEPVVPHP